jgi:hypothetical protein
MTTDATDTPPAGPPLGLSLHDGLGPLFEKSLVDFGVACRFGDTAARQGTAERIRAAARAEVAAERARWAPLVAALAMAVRQNEHDMLMTGDELRACRAALDAVGPNVLVTGRGTHDPERDTAVRAPVDLKLGLVAGRDKC